LALPAGQLRWVSIQHVRAQANFGQDFSCALHAWRAVDCPTANLQHLRHDIADSTTWIQR
jgi:hypothetical protein